MPLLPAPTDITNLSEFYTRFISDLNTVHLATVPSDRFLSSIGHVQRSPLHGKAVQGAIDVYIEDMSESAAPPYGSLDTEWRMHVGVITPTRTYSCPDRALERLLRPLLIASLPPPPPPPARAKRHPARRKEEDMRKVSLGSWGWPFGSRPSTPAQTGDEQSKGSARPGRASLEEEGDSARTSMDTARASGPSEASRPVAAFPSRSGAGGGTGSTSGQSKGGAAWLGLGNVPSAIGGAVGSMGTIFGLRSSSAAEPDKSRTIPADRLFPEVTNPKVVEAVSGPAGPAEGPDTDGLGRQRAGLATSDKEPATAGVQSASVPIEIGRETRTADESAPTAAESVAVETDDDDPSERNSIRSVLEPVVPASELAAAQSDQQALVPPLQWEERVLWLAAHAAKKRVAWTIVSLQFGP